MSGPFSVWSAQYPDKTWKVGVRLGEYKSEINTGIIKPEWTFKTISDAYHFGESEGKRKVLKELESERESHQNRSLFEKISSIRCFLFGHHPTTTRYNHCLKCGTYFGIFKKL